MPSLLRRLGAGVALASALAIAATAAHAAGPTLTAYDPTFHAMSGTAGADGQGPQGEMRAINVRCLDDIDLAAVQTTPVDGRSF